jgi:hypothetical protein
VADFSDAGAMSGSDVRNGRAVLLVPVGILWLAYELQKRERRKRSLPTKERGYYFALATVVATSIVAMVVSFAAFMGVGFSLSFLTLALWVYVLLRVLPRLKWLKKAEADDFNPAPWCTTVVTSTS